jgi:hypothetical protein
MTTKKEIKRLIADGWEVTDPSCNQMRKELIEDKTYSFREDRIINPETKESEVFEDTLDYDDYQWSELVNACETFGYTVEQVDKWITEGEEIALMLECIFELSV